MCGLVGLAGNLEYKDEAMMKRLLVLDFFRGTDSTGLASVRHNKDIKLAKGAVNPIDLFDTKKFNDTLSGAGSRALIGHNRAATLGKVNNVNAHPFECDHIIGAHNGTLDRASWNRLQEASGVTTDVDSEAIFWSIAKIGIEATIELMEEGSASNSGAWALVWYDAKEDTLNFLRNKHRPLWRAWTPDFKKLLWASEHIMLHAAAELSNVEYKLYEDKDGNSFWEFRADRLYTVELGQLLMGKFDPENFAKKTLKGRAPVVNATGFHSKDKGVPSGGTPPFRMGHQSSSTTTTGSTTLGSPKQQNTGASGVINLFGNDADPFLGYFTKEQFELTVPGGRCSFCGSEVSYEDRGLTIFEHEKVCLCSECSVDPTGTRVYTAPLRYHQYITNTKKCATN